jgi:hypothetical protein
MKKNAEAICNELVDRIETQKEALEEYQRIKQHSDYETGYYDALCFFHKWIEDGE